MLAIAVTEQAEGGVSLRMLEPVKADGSVRGVLMTLAAKDQNQYIR